MYKIAKGVCLQILSIHFNIARLAYPLYNLINKVNTSLTIFHEITAINKVLKFPVPFSFQIFFIFIDITTLLNY